MIRINICGKEQPYDQGSNSWIKQQYHERKQNGELFWFRVFVETDKGNLIFASQNSPLHGQPKPNLINKEIQIVDLWKQIGAGKEHDINHLLKFLHKLEKLLKESY